MPETLEELSADKERLWNDYSGAEEPPVRQSQSHSSDGTEPP